jgi:hypothetical protein
MRAHNIVFPIPFAVYGQISIEFCVYCRLEPRAAVDNFSFPALFSRVTLCFPFTMRAWAMFMSYKQRLIKNPNDSPLAYLLVAQNSMSWRDCLLVSAWA